MDDCEIPGTHETQRCTEIPCRDAISRRGIGQTSGCQWHLFRHSARRTKHGEPSKMRANTSILSDDETARTDPECALQRAENLAVMGVESVLELCVGPSLRVLEAAYAQHGIVATGNDIDR